jgi:amino acid transporter
MLGAAGEVAGAAVWLSFLMAGASAALQRYSFGKFGARYPSAAGLFEHTRRGFGDGHTTGAIVWLTYVRDVHRRTLPGSAPRPAPACPCSFSP